MHLKLSSVVLLFLLTMASSGCRSRSTSSLAIEVGQPVELGAWRLIVHSVTTLTADPWRQPEQGMQFLAIELTVENTSANIRYMMPENQMLLVGPNGDRAPLDASAGVLAARQSQWMVVQGEIGPGRLLHGGVSYEVPADLSGWRWVFRPELLPTGLEGVLDLREFSPQ